MIRNRISAPAVARRKRGASSARPRSATTDRCCTRHGGCRRSRARACRAARRRPPAASRRKSAPSSSAVAVEGAATGRQRKQGQDQHRRLLDMEPAQQAEHRRDREDRQRRQIGAVEPPAQAPGDQQKQHAGDAGEEVRELDHAERHHVGERRPCARPASGRRSRASSMMPAVNTISANRLGSEDQAQWPIRRPRRPLAQELVAAEQHDRHGER